MNVENSRENDVATNENTHTNKNKGFSVPKNAISFCFSCLGKSIQPFTLRKSLSSVLLLKMSDQIGAITQRVAANSHCSSFAYEKRFLLGWKKYTFI